MSEIGSNPFAEPDFSTLHVSGDDGEPDYDEERVEAGDDDLVPGEIAEVDELDLTVAGVPGSGEDLEGDDEGNRLPGGTARAVLEHIARSIVDDPDGVAVEVAETRSGVHLSLHVAQSDMGRIIGRRGRTAQALRTVVRAAAARDSQEASVDIVD